MPPLQDDDETALRELEHPSRTFPLLFAAIVLSLATMWAWFEAFGG